MKRILSSRRHHYLKRVGIFLIMIALIVVMVGCDGGGGVIKYNLTMAANPEIGGTATDLTNTSPYAAGTVVSIKAVANPGYQFVSWTAPAGGFVNANAAETTFTMPAQDVIVTANFALFAGGSGTEGDPYQIADWYQLHNVRNYLDSYFILVNDLDSTTPGYVQVASSTANEGAGWQPIGTLDDSFDGIFDGQGYEIRDLFINRPDEYSVGLFGVVDEGGRIENIGVVNATVTGGEAVGGLVGDTRGTVSNSYSTGSVSGDDDVGGLVGWNYGSTVRNSYSTSSVTGNTDVGGLVGDNWGTVSNSYSSGNVTGSYSSVVGGLVGAGGGTVSNSFWDTETSGQATSDGGTGKTTEEMQSITTFSGAGWDICAVAPGSTNSTYTWNIVDEETYPFLAGMVGYGPPSQNLEIWDWYDLDDIRDNLSGNHTLMNDLDSTTAGYTERASPTANGGKGWQPIGSLDIYWELVDPFTGTFDGQGYEIRDLFIDRPDEYGVGLFGAVVGGAIVNVEMVDADVTGSWGVGGLVG